MKMTLKMGMQGDMDTRPLNTFTVRRDEAECTRGWMLPRPPTTSIAFAQFEHEKTYTHTHMEGPETEGLKEQNIFHFIHNGNLYKK